MAIALKDSAVANAVTAGDKIMTIAHGMTIAEDDVLLAFLAQERNDSGGTTSDNNGDYPFTKDYDWIDTVNSQSHAIFSRVAGAAEPESYSWMGVGWMHYTIVLLQFSGVDVDDIWDVAPSDSTRNGLYSATATAVSQTVTMSGALAMFFVQANGARSITNPTNGFGDGVGQSASSPTVTVFFKSIASAGTIGDTSATIDAETIWRTHLLALMPTEGTYDAVLAFESVSAVSVTLSVVEAGLIVTSIPARASDYPVRCGPHVTRGRG